MINFRYHVTSLTAVLLALAAGVVLGAGFLADAAEDDGGSSEGSSDPGLTAFASGYADRTGPALVKGALDQRSVVLLTTPGARSADVKGVRAAIEDAGGRVVGQVGITAKGLDPAGRQFADGVVEQAGSNVPDVASAEAGYNRVGAAIGRAYLTTGSGDVDDDATQIRSALGEAGLVTPTDEPDARGSAAVVVTGQRTSASEPQGPSLSALAAGLDALSDGVVVAGPSSSSLDGGLVAAVREDDAAQVSTVDVADVPAGRVVVALAAARELAGEPGAWGTSRSADGAVPAAS